MIEKIKSPISGTYNTCIEKKIDATYILNKYLTEYNFDASSYFLNLKEIYIVRCLDTNYRFYYPYEVQGEEELYKHLQSFEFYYLDDRWEFEVVSNFVNKGSSLIEIGCGNGYALEQFEKKGINCFGLELNEEAITKCHKKNLNVFSTPLNEYAAKNELSFDVVCAFQLLEHLSQIEDFLKNSIKLLKKDGRLIVTVPNNDSFGHKHNTLNLPPHHMGLWNKKAFIELQKFYPIKLEKVLYTPLDDSQLNDFKDHYSNVLGKLPLILRSISRFPSLFNFFIPKRKKGYTIMVVFKKI